MKFKAIAAFAAAAALSVGMTGSALASPLKSKPAPQVTGVKLQSALLPASAFGDGFSLIGGVNTGTKLWPTSLRIKPSGLTCEVFEALIHIGGFGNTAGATADFTNPNPAFADYPNVVLDGEQAVLQFKTTQAAASFYGQAYTRYKQCTDFTESDQSDSFELTMESLNTTTIDKNKAFELGQYVTLASMPSLGLYANTAVVLDGTNLYVIDDINGTDDTISSTLLGKLIGRVQALYKR